MKESGKETFLVDGFPRNKDNLDGWTRQMGTKTDVKGVLFYECSEKVNASYIYISNWLSNDLVLINYVCIYSCVWIDVWNEVNRVAEATTTRRRSPNGKQSTIFIVF